MKKSINNYILLPTITVAIMFGLKHFSKFETIHIFSYSILAFVIVNHLWQKWLIAGYELEAEDLEKVAEPTLPKMNANININKSSKTISITLADYNLLTDHQIFHLLSGVANGLEWGKPNDSSGLQTHQNTYTIKCF